MAVPGCPSPMRVVLFEAPAMDPHLQGLQHQLLGFLLRQAHTQAALDPAAAAER